MAPPPDRSAVDAAAALRGAGQTAAEVRAASAGAGATELRTAKDLFHAGYPLQDVALAAYANGDPPSDLLAVDAAFPARLAWPGTARRR